MDQPKVVLPNIFWNVDVYEFAFLIHMSLTIVFCFLFVRLLLFGRSETLACMNCGCRHVASQLCEFVTSEFMIAVTRANHCFIMLLRFGRLGLRFYLRLHDDKIIRIFSEVTVLHGLGANVCR